MKNIQVFPEASKEERAVLWYQREPSTQGAQAYIRNVAAIDLNLSTLQFHHPMSDEFPDAPPPQ